MIYGAIRSRISSSDMNRLQGPTEVFLCLEKQQVVLAMRVSEHAGDRKGGKTYLRWPRS